MGFLEKAFELSIVISAVDKFTKPSKDAAASMAKTDKELEKIIGTIKKVKEQQKEVDAVVKGLKDMGKSAPEIDKAVAALKRLHDEAPKLEALNKQMDKYKTLTVKGAAMTGAGVMAADGIEAAVEEAGKLLTIFETIKGATGATDDQMKSIQASIRATSSVTKYDQTDTAKFAATLATSGYDAKETQELLPSFAKFAEVQEYGKGASPEESVKQAIELAHGFGKYDPKSLDVFLNQFNKGTFLQPEDSTKYGETLKYSMTTAKTLGMSDSDTMYMAALANRMGLSGSMGGTSAADMLLESIPGMRGGLKGTPHYTTIGGSPAIKGTPGTKSMQLGKNGLMKEVTTGGTKGTPAVKGTKVLTSTTYPKQLQAMMNIGMADSKGNSPFFDKGGKLIDLQGYISTLFEKTKKLTPAQKTKTFHDIFGQQGARLATLMASDNGQNQLKALKSGSDRIKSTDKMQEDYLKTPEGQLNQMKTQMKNLKMNVFLELAKTLNPFIANLNTVLTKVMAFSQKHPEISKYIATFALLGTGALLVAGPLTSMIGLIGMLNTAFKLFSAAKKAKEIAQLASGITKVSKITKIWTAIQGAFNFVMAMNPIVLIIIGIVALIAVIVVIIMHWKTVVKWLKMVWDKMKGLNDIVLIVVSVFLPFIGLPILIIKHWSTILDFFEGLGKAALKWGGNIIQGLWKGIKGAGTWFKNLFTDFVKEMIPGPILKVLGIASPSKVTTKHGLQVMQGLAAGITNNKAIVIAASKGAGMAVKTNTEIPSKVMQQQGKFMVQSLALGIKSNKGLTNASTIEAAKAVGARGSNGNGSNQYGDVQIVIHTQPGQNEEQIANMVVKKLDNKTRKKAMNKGLRVNFGSMGG